MIAFVTRVLVELVVPARHRDRNGERLRIDRRVSDRVAVVNQVGAQALEPFDRLRIRRSSVSQARLVIEIGCFDDQRVALPPAARDAVPPPDLGGQRRSSIERHHADVVDLLVENRYQPGGLEDLVGVAVPGGQRRHSVIHDAAVGRRPIQMRVGRMLALVRDPGRSRLLCFGRQWRKPPIGRIDDERRTAHRFPAIKPVIVIRAGVSRSRLGICLECPSLLVFSDLVGSQRPVLLTLAQRQGRRGGVRPDPLQVRIAPRGSADLPVFRDRRERGVERSRCGRLLKIPFRSLAAGGLPLRGDGHHDHSNDRR